jgi:hypothetical protein
MRIVTSWLGERSEMMRAADDQQAQAFGASYRRVPRDRINPNAPISTVLPLSPRGAVTTVELPRESLQVTFDELAFGIDQQQVGMSCHTLKLSKPLARFVEFQSRWSACVESHRMESDQPNYTEVDLK